jgi:NTE family protein
LVGEGLYGIGLFEWGRIYDSLEGEVSAYDGSFELVAKTALGPMFVGGSIGDNDHRKWWFGLGRVF